MRKRALRKAVSMLVCFVFLGLSASGLMAATVEQQTYDATLVLKAPIQFLLNLFPFLRDLLYNDDPTLIPPGQDETVRTIKATADITYVRVSGRD